MEKAPLDGVGGLGYERGIDVEIRLLEAVIGDGTVVVVGS